MSIAERFGRWWPRVTTFLAAVVVSGCGSSAPPPPPPPVAVTAQHESGPELEHQIRTFCGTACHSPTPPEAFPRRHWRMEVERGYRFYEQSGMALDVPPIEQVVRYFESRAPEELPHAAIEHSVRPLARRFEPVSYPPPPGPRPAISHVSLVRLPSPDRQPPADGPAPLDVLACDMQGGRVMLLRPYEPSPRWTVIGKVPHPAHAEVADLDRDGVLDVVVADLGSFPPTDRRCGGVVWLRGRPDGSFTAVTLLDNVGRVADVQLADFRGTGRLDLVVGVFGLHVAGEILLLANETTDWSAPKFVPRQVDARHGAIHVPVADLNDDGKPDFVALIAQEHEAVVAFLSQGGGEFRRQTLYSAPHPGYGSSGIQLTDLNGDGRLDVLYTNGDILDEPYLFKAYHGVQWLENKGGLAFVHHPVAPMYGAHHAVAARVAGSDRPDVVAVSFLPGDKFPDRAARKADAVVLFEQVGPGAFERHSLAGVDCDAVVCAAGDVFGTGRTDVVVGNFSSTTTDHPVTIWKNLGPTSAAE